ncbi:MAG: DNA helicase RecQ [Zetaproteobacteria bacterium CG12_big_fil_rev_8_21_14_0_65_55_1124]|nr:MAG: ATP-dependent DNA helicase RecQ [Zetaproteobacteria bacterium CG1_02_55_237]PIS19559.1 MAG: DNA helicase RecQ [Zetaproteobacteria bacterium CG08_land_8_20_14_0_20_55_17]PIW42340.1 MAG: DNA helicase RecQ [Zetaproteobacteria bacterium CG12_big_fil_rev_8_21_14_0_65_55_1124]PIY52859.1 MAG: DNA helicase RecQ [Zetaproteobacteria bacterium CG_4_10_14_0_8_um_filter_55_43]PIZ38065.1 MAG: DNA helicase RecQ [Zetaproteobacteria bacterium CG_4_10_14_0_2_um_filter_55_20]PJB79162.1 MAG: DNA helicase 
MQSPRHILKSVFGYDDFRHHQAEIIDALIKGQDVLTLMPTGGGKSICYQIPALLRCGTGIVISPLIALMQDQVDAMRQLGVRAAFLNSTRLPGEQRAIEQDLLAGELDLLYMAPERLLNSHMLDLLDRSQLALFAIDEAHCVSQWGHDFRKEYQQLSMLHERYPKVPRIALTATADQRTRDEIITQLALQKARVFINSFDRPNIHYAIAESGNSRDALWSFLTQNHAGDAGIVYCLSRKGVDAIAQWLNDKGRVALPYHAGLTQDERQRNQQRFLREDGLIIVATIAFGMGIDKPDVRFVAHMNLPKNIEAYYQETGRAGRDGLPANAWMSYGLKDVINLRLFTENSDAEEQFKRVMHQKTDAMLGLCELTGCRRQALLAYFDEALEQPCGNCDNCVSPPETWDATIATQKALSCVYRTGERFGAQYLIHVLTGKEDERIQRNGHDQLSTWNIGSEHSGAEWRGIFRQLIAHAYLATDAEGYGVLKLTSKAWGLLKRSEPPQPVMLRKLRKPSKEKAKKKKSGAAGQQDLSVQDQSLFEALRALRSQLAREQNVPPYVIFPDRTLVEMAIVRPVTLAQMLDISGIGEVKRARYGEIFLAGICQFGSSS